MRPLTWILALCLFLIASIAFAVSVAGPRTLELTEAEAKACANEGGCVVVTNAFLERVSEFIESLQRKVGKSCI